MNVLRKFLEKFRFLSFLKKRTFFNKFFIKLKSAINLKSFKNLKGLKLGLFLGVLALIISSSGVLYVYSQSGVSGSIGGSSLNKGLIAHWSLDGNLYEEGTVNLAPYTGYSNRVYNQQYNAGCWGGDVAVITYFQSGGYNNLPYKKLTKTAGGTGGCYVDEHYGVTIENNKTYIVSGYMKASRNISAVPPYILGLNRTADNTYRNGPSINLTTEWQRYSWVYTTGADHAGTYSNRGIVYEDNDLPLDVYWSGFQVEEKTYLTPFVSGTRIDRVVDATPYSRHGTNYGAASTTDRHGKSGGAMNFDGVNDRVQSSLTFSNPIALTYSVWIKTNSINSKQWIICPDNGNFDWTLLLQNGKVALMTGAGYWDSSYSISTDWTHVVAVFNTLTASASLYINGIFISNATSFGSTNTGQLTIGDYPGGISYPAPFNGSIDDVRIYNRALSEKEVSLLYGSYEPKTQISSISGGLVGHWTLSEEDYNSNTSKVTDKTPYSNNGTNSGATFTTDRHGKTGGAMSFSPGNSISVLNNSSLNTNSLSISFWAYHRDYTYPKTFSPVKKSSPNCYAAGGKGWDFGHTYNSNGVDVCVADGSNTIRQTLTFNTGSKPPDLLNKWAHITYIINRSQNKVLAYINGVKQSSEINIASITGDINNTSNLIIGGLYGWTIDGLIDDVRIYNRALSQEEISLLYSSYTPQSGGDSLQKGLVLDMPLTSAHTKTETVGSQIMTDKTPYGNDGINNGGLVTDSYTSFNGTNQYVYNIDTANPALLEPSAITVSSWINLDTDASTARHIWFTKWLGYSNEIAATTRIPYLRLNGPGDIMSSVPITPGTWHHFVGTYDVSVGGRVYLDGILVGTKAANGSITHSRTYPLNIGRYSGGIYFKGKIANARIYNRAISADEVKILYTQGAASLGGIPIKFKTSCKEILLAGESRGNGVYKIKPDSNSDAFDVYCDMTTDGGGWTLVLLNNKSLSSPTPQWLDAVSSVNTTGTFGTNLTAFDLFLGIKYWDKLGSKMRVQVGTGPTSLTNKAVYSGFSFAGSNYTLSMSGESILLGSGSTGMLSYHVGGNLSTIDVDNDIHSSHCASVYGGTPWWYKACWSGSFWGYNALEGPRWTGSTAGADVQHGSIWIGQ